MITQLFNSIYSSAEIKVNPLALIASLVTSLILGIILAKVYKHQTIYTKEFVITLSLLPAIISIIIFLVSENLGTSVAVAGTFSLIRFRSAAGGSKELLAIFMATAIGITTGMGFLILGVFFTLLISFFWCSLKRWDLVRLVKPDVMSKFSFQLNYTMKSFLKQSLKQPAKALS